MVINRLHVVNELAIRRFLKKNFLI
jgi:hypothetical protein